MFAVQRVTQAYSARIPGRIHLHCQPVLDQSYQAQVLLQSAIIPSKISILPGIQTASIVFCQLYWRNMYSATRVGEILKFHSQLEKCFQVPPILGIIFLKFFLVKKTLIQGVLIQINHLLCDSYVFCMDFCRTNTKGRILQLGKRGE